MNIAYKNFLQYFKYFICIFLFWISINTGSKYINLGYSKEYISAYNVNFIRALLPYFFILFYFLFLNKFKKNFINDLDIILKLFFIYGVFQILGLLYYLDNVYEHYWVVCLFSLLIFFNWVQQAKDEKLLNFIFLINKIAIIVIFTIFIFVTFKDNIFSETILYQSTSFNILYNDELGPRSSGLSRMALIIFFFFNSLYFSNIHKKIISTPILSINIIVLSILLLLQSRGVVLSFAVIFILINFIYKFNNIKHRCVYFVLIIIIPLLIAIVYPNIKNYGEKKSGIELGLREDILISDENENLKEKIISFSNNRIFAWDFLLQVFFYKDLNKNMIRKVHGHGYDPDAFKFKNKKNLLTGYGPQADRHLMYNDTRKGAAPFIKGPFGFNASNGYIYSLVSSGLLGLIIFISLNLIIFFKILKIIIYHKPKYLSTKPYLSSSILCTIFLQARLLFENSFAIYGVDLLILLSSYLIIQNEFRRLKN